jgi:hypothetical protein
VDFEALQYRLGIFAFAASRVPTVRPPLTGMNLATGFVSTSWLRVPQELGMQPGFGRYGPAASQAASISCSHHA